jgi:ABC-type polysaccharide/polyol phosphate transport system ATPase subunit
MYGRLAFAVAINMDPDILLIDEALSAGDAKFKEKSFAKMRELCEQARTIVIVSHAMATLTELCDRAIWMHKGELLASGDVESVTDKYLEFLNVQKKPSTLEDL